MVRIRYILLPIRYWQYVGFIVLFLICLTCGLSSCVRKRSFTESKLMYIGHSKIDVHPRNNQVYVLLSLENSFSYWNVTVAVQPTKTISENCNSHMLVCQTKINYKPYLISSHSDATRLISNPFQKRHSLGIYEIHIQFMKRRNIYNKKNQKKSIKYQDNSFQGHLRNHIISRHSDKTQYIFYLQMDKFNQLQRKLPLNNDQFYHVKNQINGKLYNLHYRQRLFINFEYQTVLYNLHNKNQPNSKKYNRNSRRENQKIYVYKNVFRSQEKHILINKVQRQYHNRNNLIFRSNRKIVNTQYQLREVINQYYFTVKNHRKTINEKYQIFNSINKQFHINLNEYNLVNPKNVHELINNQLYREFRFLSQQYVQNYRVDNRSIRTNKVRQSKEDKQYSFIIEIPLFELWKDFSKTKRITFNKYKYVYNRNIPIQITHIESSKKHKLIDSLQNHILWIENVSKKKYNLLSKIIQNFSKINQEILITQQRTRKGICQKRFFDILSVNKKTKNIRKNNKFIDKIELQKHKIEKLKNKQQNLIRITENTDQKYFSIKHPSGYKVSRKLRIISTELKQIMNYQLFKLETSILNRNQINRNRPYKNSNEKQINMQKNNNTGHFNLNNKPIRYFNTLKIKTKSIDLYYLKTIVMDNNLDFEILCQSFLIAIFIMYCFSIFNRKDVHVRNFVQCIRFIDTVPSRLTSRLKTYAINDILNRTI